MMRMDPYQDPYVHRIAVVGIVKPISYHGTTLILLGRHHFQKY